MITLAGTRDTWTPVCLARAGLIVWDPNGIPKWPSKKRNGITHHKSDRKPCVKPTADRNKIYLACYFKNIYRRHQQKSWQINLLLERKMFSDCKLKATFCKMFENIFRFDFRGSSTPPKTPPPRPDPPKRPFPTRSQTIDTGSGGTRSPGTPPRPERPPNSPSLRSQDSAYSSQRQDSISSTQSGQSAALQYRQVRGRFHSVIR